MKSKSLKLLTIPFISFLSSCSSNSCLFVGHVYTENDGLCEHNYMSFEGQYNFVIDSKYADNSIKVEITCNSGTLSLEIANQSTNDIACAGNYSESTSFTVNIDKASYNVKLTTKEHCGGFKFAWKA